MHVLAILTGYLIPKGWKVMPLFRSLHQNPKFFNDSQNFDPSRFEVCFSFFVPYYFSEKVNRKTAENVFFLVSFSGDGWVQVAPKPNTFMPFGNGVHACPGNELAKLEMLILIHHLMTKFRYYMPSLSLLYE